MSRAMESGFAAALTLGALTAMAVSCATRGSESAAPERIELYGGAAIARKAPEGAAQWRPLAVGAGGQNLRMAFDPKNADRVYVAIDVAGVVKSEDGGRRWLNSNAGLHGLAEGGYPASDVAVAPGDGSKLFASWGRAFKDNGGIAESNDFGESWRLLSGEVFCNAEGKPSRKDGGPGLLIDPSNSKRMYCIDSKHGNGAGGVWISDDAGRRWRPSGLTKRQVSTIRFKPGDSKTLYASCASEGLAEGGFFVSEDAGEAWAPRGLAGLNVRNFEFDVKSPLTIYAVCGLDGFWRSEDGGASWKESNEGLPLKRNGASAKHFDYFYRAIAADPFSGRLLTGADPIRAFFESTDGGRSWKRLPARGEAPKGWMLENEHFGWHTNNIYFHPLVKGRLFLCDFFGTWRSDDGGSTWSINPYGQESSCMVGVLPDAKIQGRLYLGLWDHFLLLYDDDPEKPRTLRCEGLYKPEGVNKHVSGIVQSAKSPERMLCVTNSSIPFRSGDRGLTWTRAVDGLPPNLDFRLGTPALASLSDVAFLPVNGDGVYKSVDGGKSWSRPANKGLPGLNLSGRWDPRQCVFAASPDASLVAAASDGKLLLSDDACESWRTPAIPCQAGAVAIDALGELLLGGRSGGLWKSSDKGASWTKLPGIEKAVKLIAVDPARPERILCHSSAKDLDGRIAFSLKISQDGGSTWSELLNESLPVWNLQGLAFDPFDERAVYANSYWCGAWAAKLP